METKARANIDVSSLLAGGRSRYDFRAQEDEATVNVFGEIDDWWGFGVREMAYNLSSNKRKKLKINIHSPGGSVTEGIGIANLIRAHDGETTSVGIGFVASIASIILMAADRVTMARNAFLMIHNPWAIAAGDSDEMRKTADVLDKMENELANIYAAFLQSRGKDTSIEEVKKMMAEETWFTADEAQAAGFIDEVTDNIDFVETPADAEEQMATLAKYQHMPQALADVLHNFSNSNKNVMAEKNNSIFAKLGQLFSAAAQEIDAPEAPAAEEPQPDNTDTTMTVEEARKLLEREGYTVAEKIDEQQPEKEAQPEEEYAEVMALKKQVQDLTDAVKRKVGAPSGGSTAENKDESAKRPKAAMPFFDSLANVVKNHYAG